MKLSIVPILLLMTGPTIAFSQLNVQDFKISLPETKVSSSLYNSISLLDSRENTYDLGMVQTGLMNRPAVVMAYEPLEKSVQDIFQSLNPQDAGNGRLLLQLRHFTFAEKSGFSSEHGYFYFTANLYKDSLDKSYLISSIDTIVDVKAIDVTQKILHMGRKAFIDFIAAGMSKPPLQPVTFFTNDQLQKVDDIEKAGIPLYNADTLKDGIYNDFTSFKDQTPDWKIEDVKIREGLPEAVFINNEHGKRRKVNRAAIYAFVQGGKPYIATHFGYYPLINNHNDFFFTGKMQFMNPNSNVATAAMLFGLIGYAIASSNNSTVIDVKIDHLTGAFIPLRPIQ